MRTILVIEDDGPLARVLQEVLEDEGYQVLLAGSGVAGLQVLSQLEREATGLPGLILCDMLMPGLSGLEVCQQIRQSSRYCTIPFAIMTGLPKKELLSQGIRVDAVILKPFDLNELVSTVNGLLPQA